MRTRAWKRAVTIAMIVVTTLQLGGMQPMFFGVKTYFGINPLVFLLPMSFVFIVIASLHWYQVWPLLRLWFKKSPTSLIRRDKRQRMAVLISFVVILSCSIANAWYYALKEGIDGMPMQSIRILSWVATGLLVVHVLQRWRLTVSYFKRSRRRTVKHEADAGLSS